MERQPGFVPREHSGIPDTEESKQHNEYVLASAAVVHPRTIALARESSIANLTEMAVVGGLDGIELWAHKGRVEHELKLQPQLKRPGVLSVHQTPESDQTGSILHRTKDRFILHAAFAEAYQSLLYLESLGEATGGLDVVIFKETPDDLIFQPGFRHRMIQTDPEVCALWEVQSGQEFVETALEKGFNPIPDTNHIRRHSMYDSRGNPLANWEQSLPPILEHAVELHVGVGRVDPYAAGGPTQSVRELMALMRGDDYHDTVTVKMLRLISQHWRGRVVLEFMPPSVPLAKENMGIDVHRNLLSPLHRQIARADIVEVCQRVRITLDAIFD